jgi:hypothetical protein
LSLAAGRFGSREPPGRLAKGRDGAMTGIGREAVVASAIRTALPQRLSGDTTLA